MANFAVDRELIDGSEEEEKEETATGAAFIGQGQ